MFAAETRDLDSKQLAIRLFDSFVRERQQRSPDLTVPQTHDELAKLGLKNFDIQYATPRRQHLEGVRKFGERVSTADKVALLVAMELPSLEISSLLQRLSRQVTTDPETRYFSKVNMADNCGCGCGCGCAVMASLPYDERIYTHLRTKPFSIDPFNEIGLAEKERDELMAKDFLASYEVLSEGISERVNQRYFEMARSFG